MARNQNASSSSRKRKRKRFNTRGNGGAAPWSNLNQDVLFLVTEKLEFVDFLSFNGVCKSWRSLTFSNMTKRMSSRPPMVMSISHTASNKNLCLISDFELRNFKIPLPPSASSVSCFGLTCGYLILFGNARHDFLLVNPITGHQLRFPACSLYFNDYPDKAMLVYSPSLSRWVFVISDRNSTTISFYVSGKRRWKHVPSKLDILDLHAFKGKIYALHTNCRLSEMRLNPIPKLTLLETKNILVPDLKQPELVRSVENLCVIDWLTSNNEVLELDFGEMKWVSLQNTKGEHAVFISTFHYFGGAAIKPELWESWADPQTQLKIDSYLRSNIFNTFDTRPGTTFYSKMWYFPHECLKVNLLDE